MILLVAALVALVGCGGGGGGGVPTVATIVVYPDNSLYNPLQVMAGISFTFHAEPRDASGNPVETTVTWATSGGIGTIDPLSGQFTATTTTSSTSPVSGQVTASADGVSTSVNVAVVPGPVTAIEIEPPAGVDLSDVPRGTQVQFTAVGEDEYGNRGVRILVSPRWSVRGGVGTITAEGLFAAVTPGTGEVVAELEVPGVGTLEDSVAVTVTGAGVGLAGFVLDLFDEWGISGANVALDVVGSDVSDATGFYSVETGGDYDGRVTITRSGYYNRVANAVVSGAWTTRDITLVPTTFNMLNFEALMGYFGGEVSRWYPNPPQRYVIYRYTKDTNQAVSQSQIDAVQEVLNNEVAQHIGPWLQPVTIEVYNGRPQDDSRLTSVNMGAADPWYIHDGWITIMWVTTSGGWLGIAGWSTSGYNIVYASTQLLLPVTKGTIRHELGHCYGFAHPHDFLTDWNQLVDSVMNYDITGHSSETYTLFDRQSFRLAYARPPGNSRPDTDPVGAGVWRGVRRVFVTP